MRPSEILSYFLASTDNAGLTLFLTTAMEEAVPQYAVTDLNLLELQSMLDVTSARIAAAVEIRTQLPSHKVPLWDISMYADMREMVSVVRQYTQTPRWKEIKESKIRWPKPFLAGRRCVIKNCWSKYDEELRGDFQTWNIDAQPPRSSLGALAQWWKSESLLYSPQDPEKSYWCLFRGDLLEAAGWPQYNSLDHLSFKPTFKFGAPYIHLGLDDVSAC